MPTLTVTKSYSDGGVLTETQLNTANSSIETFLNSTKLNDDNIQAGGITEACLATGSITRAKLASVGLQASSAVTASAVVGSAADISGLTITITTSGRPVFVGLTHIAATDPGYLWANYGRMFMYLYRGTTLLAAPIVGVTQGLNSTIKVPASSVFYLDTPTAGTYTYKIQAYLENLSPTVTGGFNNVKLIAYEL